MIKTNNLGYPRIGVQRELKKACERYWAGKGDLHELEDVGAQIRAQNWRLQQQAGIDLIPCNDFSYYDQVLDMSMLLGGIPHRYDGLFIPRGGRDTELYFAMARGLQSGGLDVTAMEMTKWFDTNYHYLVPEFHAGQTFRLSSQKVFDEFEEAGQVLGRAAKPVLIGPVSYLLLGKEKESGFHRLDLLDGLLPVYEEILLGLEQRGAEWLQMDEPFLALDLTDQEKDAYQRCYARLQARCPELRLMVATYFEGLRDNIETAISLPVSALHIDLVRAPDPLPGVLEKVPDTLSLSLGVVDGRNIWKNDYKGSLRLIDQAIQRLGGDRVMIAPSCSLLHVPSDLDLETDLDADIKDWLAFAKQKLWEVTDLSRICDGDTALLEKNQTAIQARRMSDLIHDPAVKQRAAAVTEDDMQRQSPFSERQPKQQERFNLPLFPTTTIGSFPQTPDIRKMRAAFRRGNLSAKDYDTALEAATEKAVRLQEDIGLDVLVHGEFERNDMVEYFGEQLDGFAFTRFGWVQSYGSRCVKPPIIYGDVKRTDDMTVRWSQWAQSRTDKMMKGMLTGPVTILQWSFVRNDQPRSATARQIALAMRDEVAALEKAGIRMIQIDEPALREGLPLRRSDWPDYLDWAVNAFRLASSGVRDDTQIHTHMCYSEFNDILASIAALDADVITMETSRSQMELLDAFADFKYPNEIGPGVYDIHSPRVPSVEEMVTLLEKAAAILPVRNLWVNPDCGLKTRQWPETEAALRNMVQAASEMRQRCTANSS